MRVLVVGAGVGGLTLAGLLGDVDVEVVERAPALRPDGFGLLLYPFGSAVLHGIGCFEALLAQGCVLSAMSLRDGRGGVVEDYDLRDLTARAGPLVCVRRSALMGLLEARAADRVRWRLGTTVAALDGTAVTFSDGETARYDVVVVSDGMRSPTRRLLRGDTGRRYEPGHEMFVWWGPDGLCASDRVVEWWAPGCAVAVFPVPGAAQCSVLVPAGAGDPRARITAALEGVGGATLDGVRTALGAAGELYPWALADVRAGRWTDGGRVALLGDAAVGSLPTAGVGASSAMRSAAILAEELSRVDAAGVPPALERYVGRARVLAEREQRESRRFGRAMMIDSRLGTRVRDGVLRHVSASHLLSGLIASLAEPA